MQAAPPPPPGVSHKPEEGAAAKAQSIAFDSEDRPVDNGGPFRMRPNPRPGAADLTRAPARTGLGAPRAPGGSSRHSWTLLGRVVVGHWSIQQSGVTGTGNRAWRYPLRLITTVLREVIRAHALNEAALVPGTPLTPRVKNGRHPRKERAKSTSSRRRGPCEAWAAPFVGVLTRSLGRTGSLLGELRQLLGTYLRAPRRLVCSFGARESARLPTPNARTAVGTGIPASALFAFRV